jgi:hypothetical protein
MRHGQGRAAIRVTVAIPMNRELNGSIHQRRLGPSDFAVILRIADDSVVGRELYVFDRSPVLVDDSHGERLSDGN